MKTIEFKDLNGQELTVQYSSLATEQAYRIYIKPNEHLPWKQIDCESGKEVLNCIHINKPQVQILIAALQDLMGAEDD